jgi:hypothetical protein
MKRNKYVCHLKMHNHHNKGRRAREMCGSEEWSAKGENIATLKIELKVGKKNE